MKNNAPVKTKGSTQKITALFVALALMSPLAFADSKKKYDYARVVSVEAITKTIRVSTPRQECWQAQVPHYKQAKQRSATPTIIGAVIGGLIGNELGNNPDARKGGLLVGSILGGSIGRDIGRRNARPGHLYYTTEQQCETYQDYHEEERISGYQVDYKYHGNMYHTRTRNHPGERIKVSVTVTPVEEY